MQNILPIPLPDHHGLRCWQRLVASCAGGHASRPHLIIDFFLLVHHLLIFLYLLLPVLLFRGCCVLLRRCSRPSGLDGYSSRRHTTCWGDKAASLWKIGSW